MTRQNKKTDWAGTLGPLNLLELMQITDQCYQHKFGAFAYPYTMISEAKSMAPLSIGVASILSEVNLLCK